MSKRIDTSHDNTLTTIKKYKFVEMAKEMEDVKEKLDITLDFTTIYDERRSCPRLLYTFKVASHEVHITHPSAMSKAIVYIDERRLADWCNLNMWEDKKTQRFDSIVEAVKKVSEILKEYYEMKLEQCDLNTD